MLACLLLISGCHNSDTEPVKVGILHSLTGTMAISEKPVVDATLLAIEEINQNGGLLGREIIPIVVDGQSDASIFAREAERLIVEEHVAAIFGCWTSACRKRVKPVVERNHNILFYPIQHEGIEQSPNIIYGGLSANQQIIPAINWAVQGLGKRIFLVGSDYIYPRIANEIIKNQLTALKIEPVGEVYLELGDTNITSVVEQIKASGANLIINTINGDTNIAFFTALDMAGIKADRIPVLSFSVSETELQQLGAIAAGHYASWSYFQSIDSEHNRNFIQRFKKRFGESRVINDPMVSAYTNVQIWATTVEEAKSLSPEAVLSDIKHQQITSPAGAVIMDQETLHQWKQSRIGRVRPDGQFDIIWQSMHLIEPVPFPLYRTPAVWRDLVSGLYDSWMGSWENPGSEKLLAVKQQATAARAFLIPLEAQPQLLSLLSSTASPIDDKHIQLIENSWPGLTENDTLIRSLLHNNGAKALRHFMQQHPRFSEIFVTDQQGLIVAMSNKTSDYYQRDEVWWQKTYAKGMGRSWQGEIEFDASANSWAIPIYLPIKDNSGRVDGVIKALFNIKPSQASQP